MRLAFGLLHCCAYSKRTSYAKLNKHTIALWRLSCFVWIEKKIARCWLFYLIWFKQSPLLHWIFGVSDCICGRCWLHNSTVGHFFVPKMMQIASKWTIRPKLSSVHELIIGMNEHWNGQMERCEAKGHERLMVFCYSASENGTEKMCILHNERFIVSRY